MVTLTLCRDLFYIREKPTLTLSNSDKSSCGAVAAQHTHCFMLLTVVEVVDYYKMNLTQ